MTPPPSKILARFNSTSGSLAELSLHLLESQRSAWGDLAVGVDSLASVRTRDVVCKGFSVRLQFNPARIVSTSAKVDEKTIRERRCFLCVENLPAPQQGILYGDEFLLLCNPAPIFFGHYTISHLEHRPQRLQGNVPTFLALGRDLGPKFTVFYNGPKCGASAPDHLHFQASPSGAIPIERLAASPEIRKHVAERNGTSVLRLHSLGRAVIVLEGNDAGGLSKTLLRLMDRMKAVMNHEEETKVNILCSYSDSRWRVIVFPRSKHRPDVFFLKGENRVLISPAAVDIGGLIITPLERDFVRTDAALVERIFAEVSITDRTLDEILEGI